MPTGGLAAFLVKTSGSPYTDPERAKINPRSGPTPGAALRYAPREEREEGITGGGGGNYCPNDPVTRAQMAAFLLESEYGSTHVPPCAGIFGDVTCPSLFADWIEQLAAEGMTGGCGGGNYCPDNPNTRGQMAVFLVKTFGRPSADKGTLP